MLGGKSLCEGWAPHCELVDHLHDGIRLNEIGHAAFEELGQFKQHSLDSVSLVLVIDLYHAEQRSLKVTNACRRCFGDESDQVLDVVSTELTIVCRNVSEHGGN